MKKRKVCIVTGSRAEYGLLQWLMKELRDDSSIDLQIIATGMHLMPEFGLTYLMIEKDGFSISAKVEMPQSGDTRGSVVRAMSEGLKGFAGTWEKLSPDLIVVLGDRYEILTAVESALIFGIPVAHLHGGELTEGAFDDAIRHSMTKMSHLHFVAAEEYKKRVIQLGETPAHIFNVGAIGLDAVTQMEYLSRENLEKDLGFQLGQINFLVTYHPTTLDKQGPGPAMDALFSALDRFPEAKVLFTKSNSDPGGLLIGKMIDRYVAKNSKGVAVFTALGQQRYLSLAKQCDVVIGNSSSGLIEIPALKKPTVNIGDRQKGRLRGNTVIDCEETSQSIETAIKKALSLEFKQVCAHASSPYGGDGQTARKIKDVIKSTDLSKITQKRFHDL